MQLVLCLVVYTPLPLSGSTSHFCIPILLYGCELWSVTASEITMLERVHHKILRTIQGLPLRCHSKALQCLMGAPSILSLIQQRQLKFLYSLSLLPADSLPHLVLIRAPHRRDLFQFLDLWLISLISPLSLPSSMESGVSLHGRMGEESYTASCMSTHHS